MTARGQLISTRMGAGAASQAAARLVRHSLQRKEMDTKLGYQSRSCWKQISPEHQPSNSDCNIVSVGLPRHRSTDASSSPLSRLYATALHCTDHSVFTLSGPMSAAWKVLLMYVCVCVCLPRGCCWADDRLLLPVSCASRVVCSISFVFWYDQH